MTRPELDHYEYANFLFCENTKKTFEWRTGDVECPHCGEHFEVKGEPYEQ